MSITKLEVTDRPDVCIGDDVVLLGSQKWPGRGVPPARLGDTHHGEITASEIADAPGTIT